MNLATPVETLVTEHLDLWTAALKRKSAAGRGSSSKVELYGIKKLRELILELAVRGLLVPQDPNDEPASELLKRIAVEKARLVKEGKIKKEKSAFSADDRPFALASNWNWTSLQELNALVTDGDHQAPPKADSGIPFLVIGNLNTGTVDFSGCKYVPTEYFENLDWGKKPSVSDLLYTVTGSYGIPASVSSDRKFCVQRHVAILKSTDSTPTAYLHVFLRSRLAFDYASSVATGIAQKTVPLSGLRAMPVPLPPVAEQHRIVAKVDELMALCDQLEQETEASLGAHQTLVETLLSALTSAADHAQFASAWQRIAGHFDTLFTTEASIAQLKQTILQLAVMGKLVPQDPNDCIDPVKSCSGVNLERNDT